MNEGSSRKPNIVIFNPDEMRLDSLAHMGLNPAAVTPNLDRFEREDAVSFRNAFCQNPVCVPSRCSFLTGLYPHVSGHRTMQYMLQSGESSLFSELRNAGYFVWLNDRNDFAAGQIKGLYPSHADIIYSGKRDPRVNTPDHNRPVNPDIRGEKGGKFYYAHYLGELTDDGNGVNYTSDDSEIDECLRVMGEDHEGKSVCAFLGLFYPHCPYGVEEPYFSLIDRKKLPQRASIGSGKSLMLSEIRKYSCLDKLGEKDWNEIRASYLGMCSKVDAEFGRLVEGLKSRGLYDDTLIIVLSDHGDFNGDYSLVEKAQNSFEDCLVRVPLIIKPPKREKTDAGITDSLAELVDFYATVMDYASVEPDHDQYGKSLRPVIENRNREIRDFVFSEGGRMPYEWQADEYHGSSKEIAAASEEDAYWPKKMAQSCAEAHAKGTMIRDRRYKYIKRSGGRDEFYDLENDPKEERNEIYNPVYSERILLMQREMLSWYQDTCDIVPRKKDNRIDIRSIENMTKDLPEESRRMIMTKYDEGMGFAIFGLIKRERMKTASS